MSQKTDGIFAFLSAPIAYANFQNIVGAKSARQYLVENYFNLPDVERILDIGCGTADILDSIPLDCEYVGFDTSREYIAHAQTKYASRDARFFAEEVGSATLSYDDKFDLVLATGVIHHLDDATAVSLFKFAKSALSSKGRFFTIDPCFVDNQSKISKTIIGMDRGQNVRNLTQYKNLADQVFDTVTVHHRNDLLRLPYDHALMVCRL